YLSGEECVNVMAPGTVLAWSCLEFLPGYSLPCIGGMAFRETGFLSPLFGGGRDLLHVVGSLGQ
ncbi:hypothetical protein J8994_29430, partial [Klebsiella pneumoniae]